MLINFGKERGFINFTWKELCVVCSVLTSTVLAPLGTFVYHAIGTKAEFSIVEKELADVRQRELICEDRLTEVERLLTKQKETKVPNPYGADTLIAPDYTIQVSR